MVTFTTEVPLDAGTWRVGLALEQQPDSAGDTLHDPMVPVPDGTGAKLALSDIVLGGRHRRTPLDGSGWSVSPELHGQLRQGRADPALLRDRGCRRG